MQCLDQSKTINDTSTLHAWKKHVSTKTRLKRGVFFFGKGGSGFEPWFVDFHKRFIDELQHKSPKCVGRRIKPFLIYSSTYKKVSGMNLIFLIPLLND